jgi:hypothetical protein
MEQQKAMEYGSRKASPDVLKPHIYIYIYIVHKNFFLTMTSIITSQNIGLSSRINLLKPPGYAMHQQFNIQQLYALPALCLCVLYLSENKQRIVLLTS